MICIMKKFEKAQQILQKVNVNGWLIVCNEDNDIHSKYLLGVGSHALHAIFIAADGNHKVLSVVMEANMIKNSLKKRGDDAEVIPFNSTMDFIDKFIS